MSIKGVVKVTQGETELDDLAFDFEVPVEDKYAAFMSALETVAGPFKGTASATVVCTNDERSHTYFVSEDSDVDQVSRFENPTSIRIIVSVASDATAEKVPVVASIRGSAGGDTSFDFVFHASQDGILEAFKKQCADKFELDSPAITVFIKTVEGEGEVNGDRVFWEILSQRKEDGAPIVVSVQPVVTSSKITVTVASEYREGLTTKEAEFPFSYSIDQEQLLSSLKAACASALELDDEEGIDLSIIIENDSITLQSDQQLRDIFFSLLGVDKVSIHVARALVKAPVTSFPVEVTFEDRHGQFVFRHALDDQSVLSHFKSECAIELELNVQDEYALQIISSEEELIVITSDKQLGDVLIAQCQNRGAEGSVGLVCAQLISIARPVKIAKKIACSMNGEMASIDFVYDEGQDNLLGFLIEECKGPFELFPSDDVVLYVVLDNEEIPLVQESQVVEVLTNCQSEIINLRMLDAKDVPPPPPQVKTVALIINHDEEVSQTSLTYPVGEFDAVLEKVQQEVRNELFISDDRRIAIYVVNGDKTRSLLNNSDQIASLENNATLQLEVQILGESPQELDRQGELEVLSYDWSDILEVTFDAQDIRQVFVLLKTPDGVSVPSSDPLNIHLADFISKNRPQPIAELLPILTHWTSHMNDEEVAAFCHQCRDVIDFMVNVSNAFRLRRALSAAFRSLAVAGFVSTQELSRLLLDTGRFEPDAVEHVVDGSPSQLGQTEFNEVMTQLLGDRPQDIIDFLSAAKDVAHPTARRAEKEITVLRRKRLRADILHTMDGVTPFVLNSVANDFAKTTDATILGLFRSVASLMSVNLAKCDEVDDYTCRDWVVENIKSEDSAIAFTELMTSFSGAKISQKRLTDVCHLLLSPDHEPSALLQVSTGCWALGRWALKAAQLVCHNKRVPFPPVPLEKFIPKAPSAESPVRPSTSGLSSPSRLRAQLAATRVSSNNAVVPSPSSPSRYDFRFTHLCRDLGLTEDMPTYSLKELLPPKTVQNDDDLIKPAAAEPTPAAAEPTPTAAEPTPVAAEPTPAAAEPTPAAAEPTPAGPMPVEKASHLEDEVKPAEIEPKTAAVKGGEEEL